MDKQKQIEEMALRLRSEDRYCLSVTCSCCTLSQENTCCEAYQAAIKLHKAGYGDTKVAIREFAKKLLELYTDPDISDNYVVPIGVVKQNIKDILKEYEE